MASEIPGEGATAHVPREMTRENVRRWARAYVAHLVTRPESEIDLYRPFSDHGLDSMDAVVMAGEMEEHFAIEIDPGLFLQETMTMGELIEQFDLPKPPAS
jgi:acyl carrier protein